MERRKAARAGVKGRVEIRFDTFTSFVVHYVTNLSAGGMFIRTSDVRPPGTLLEFRLTLGDGETTVHGTAEVVWARASGLQPKGPAGMAVRFLDLDEGGREAVRRAIEREQEFLERGALLNERPTPVAVDVLSGEEPFEEEGETEAVRAEGMAFDVFPLPDLEEEEEVPAPVPETPLLEHLDEDLTLGHPASGRSPGLLVAGVALAVALLAGFAYFLSHDGGEGSGASLATPTAPATATASQTPAAEEAIAAGSTAQAGHGIPTPARVETAPVAATPRRAANEPKGVKGRAARRGSTSGRRTVGGGRAGRPAAARRLVQVLVQRKEGVTGIELALDGVLAESRLHTFPMRNPPRYVIQMTGIQADDPFAVLSIATPEVHRVRLGYHGKGRTGYLQVVLDLVTRGGKVRQERSGNSIQVYVEESSQ